MKCFARSSGSNAIKIKTLYLTGVLFFVLSMAAGLFFGGTKVDFGQIISSLRCGELQSAVVRIFLYVRLPRTAAALLAGAALSVSGAVTQSVLANRLASPSVIGVNAGAGLAVTLCTALGLYGGWRLSLFAFLGAFLAVMTVSLGAKVWGASTGTVILLGVAMNSLLGAVSDSIVTFFPDVGVMRNDFRMGDFSGVTYQTLLPAACLILLSLAVLYSLANGLDVLTLGEERASSLGMNTALMRVVFLMIAALLAGCAVSVGGLLSFVGLIVPHAIRRVSKCSTVHLLPLCTLFGGGFVCLSDTAARTLFAPYEIPVGILLAFLGAPFFIFILIKGKED